MHVDLDTLRNVERMSAEGRHAEVVLLLDAYPGAPESIEASQTLALYYGLAKARLTRFADARRWISAAAERARRVGDRYVALKALNVQGAIALEQGRLAKAKRCLDRGLHEAMAGHDFAMAGRFAANLGIVAQLRGDHDEAIRFYALADAAFQQVGDVTGVVIAHVNRAISFRQRGQLDDALDEIDRASNAAAALRDASLTAAVLRNRALVHAARGDAELAASQALAWRLSWSALACSSMGYELVRCQLVVRGM